MLWCPKASQTQNFVLWCTLSSFIQLGINSSLLSQAQTAVTGQGHQLQGAAAQQSHFKQGRQEMQGWTVCIIQRLVRRLERQPTLIVVAILYKERWLGRGLLLHVAGGL